MRPSAPVEAPLERVVRPVGRLVHDVTQELGTIASTLPAVSLPVLEQPTALPPQVLPGLPTLPTTLPAPAGVPAQLLPAADAPAARAGQAPAPRRPPGRHLRRTRTGGPRPPTLRSHPRNRPHRPHRPHRPRAAHQATPATPQAPPPPPPPAVGRATAPRQPVLRGPGHRPARRRRCRARRSPGPAPAPAGRRRARGDAPHARAQPGRPRPARLGRTASPPRRRAQPSVRTQATSRPIPPGSGRPGVLRRAPACHPLLTHG